MIELPGPKLTPESQVLFCPSTSQKTVFSASDRFAMPSTLNVTGTQVARVRAWTPNGVSWPSAV